MDLGTTAFNPSSGQGFDALIAAEPVQAPAKQKKWHYQPAVAGYTDDAEIRERLKNHARLAAPGLHAIGKSLTSIFKGCTYEQRLKDDERIGQKSGDRYRNNSQCILDYLAGRLRICTLEQAMAIMDIFSTTGPLVLPNGLTINVRDIKDKLTRCSDSGLPVLAMKLDIPFWTETGVRQIHISELQVVPKDAFPLWDKSYAIYRKMRNRSADRTALEDALGGVEIARLSPEWQKINSDVERLAAQRTQINLQARANILWLDDLQKMRRPLEAAPAEAVRVLELQPA
jgi:hypothetical protein